MKRADADLIIGRFYINRKRYRDAKPYLFQALSLGSSVEKSAISNIEYFLFKTDSASGAYTSAIRHYNQHVAINDSILNETKNRQIAELEIAYETSQKEKSIKLLENKSEKAQSELRQISIQRNLTLGGGWHICFDCSTII